MIGEATEVAAGSQIEADVCVIGAGAAGIAIARALSGHGLRILVLESGGRQYETATQDLYKGRSDLGIPYFELDAPRLRYFGGTTGHWAGTCRPFEAIDFAPRPGVPDTGWPIGLDDIDPYYAEAERVVGLDGTTWRLDELADDDEFGPLDLGPGIVSRVARFADDERRHFGTRFSAELEAARDVDVRLHANVTELEADPSSRHVARAHVATLGGHRFTVAARRFVLACGALENARVLLISDRHQRGGLGNRHDTVGRWFCEHPRLVGAQLLPAHYDIETRFYDAHRTDGQQIEGYLALSDAAQIDQGLLDVQLKLRPIHDGAYEGIDDRRDVRALRALRGERKDVSREGLGRDVMNVASDLLSFERVTVPGAPLPVPYPAIVGRLFSGTARERLDLIPGVLGDIAGHTYSKLIGSAPVALVEVTTRLGQQPNRDSRVTLGRERDALGQRRLELDWRLTDLDRESIVRSLEVAGAAIGAAGLGRLQILLERDGPWPQDVRGGWHMMGTTRMSNDPRRGVVDRDCRVHGVDNLYVAGSSVFATAGTGTPTLTLVALALRLADTLKGQLR